MDTVGERTGNVEACIDDLSQLPLSLEQILDISCRDGCSAREIAAICESEPELAGRLLAVVNSLAANFRRPIPTLLEAAVLVGIQRIRNLALAVHLAQSLELPGSVLETTRFFRHAFTVAACARAIGQRARSHSAEDMYLAGLLHDMGHAVLAKCCAESYLKILEAPQTTLIEAETSAVGMSHAEAGSRLASRWSLGRRVVNAVRFHEENISRLPGDLEPDSREVLEALVVAEMVARHHGVGLVRRHVELPDHVDIPGWISASRDSLVDGFGAFARGAEELVGLLGLAGDSEESRQSTVNSRQ